MPRHATQRRTPRPVVIPDKLYFRIGEVARLCGVETYVLRFWETEFPQLRPNKSGTGQRLYRKRDVELAMRVRQLLHAEGYTIAGARQLLAQEARAGRSKSAQLSLIENGAVSPAAQAKLQRLRAELSDLLGILSAAPGTAAVRRHEAAAKTRTARPSPVVPGPSNPNLFDR